MGPCGPPEASALQVESLRTTNAGSGTIVVRFSCLHHRKHCKLEKHLTEKQEKQAEADNRPPNLGRV